jgi:hypothetical protein
MFPEYINFKKYPWNLAKLTPRQHFIAHLILCKAYPSYNSQFFAFGVMQKSKSSKLHEKLRKKHRKLLSELTKGKQSTLKGRTYEDIHGKQKAEKLKEEKRKLFANRTFSEETKIKMKTNHANVSGGNNPKAISGVLYNNTNEVVCTFKSIIELYKHCKKIGIPYRGITSPSWVYNPVITNRNKKFIKFVGYHCVMN